MCVWQVIIIMMTEKKEMMMMVQFYICRHVPCMESQIKEMDRTFLSSNDLREEMKMSYAAAFSIFIHADRGRMAVDRFGSPPGHTQ